MNIYVVVNIKGVRGRMVHEHVVGNEE